MLTAISQSINRDLPLQFEKVMRKELAQFAPAVAQLVKEPLQQLEKALDRTVRGCRARERERERERERDRDSARRIEISRLALRSGKDFRAASFEKGRWVSDSLQTKRRTSSESLTPVAMSMTCPSARHSAQRTTRDTADVSSRRCVRIQAFG